MKKFFMLATAAFLISGVSFAHDGKKCRKGKKCSKKEAGCCKHKDNKDKTAKI